MLDIMLAAFQGIARRSPFSAAEALKYSQSAGSHHNPHLEREYGMCLERSSREGVCLNVRRRDTDGARTNPRRCARGEEQMPPLATGRQGRAATRFRPRGGCTTYSCV